MNAKGRERYRMQLRVWALNRRAMEAARRRRRLAPGAIALSLVMIFGAFLFVVIPPPSLASGTTNQNPNCIPCPSGGGCYPNCSGGGCPKGTVAFTVIMETINPTNVTIKWSVYPSATVSLHWGNSTSYSFTAINSQGTGTSWQYTFLDYLEPNTKYYYKFTGQASCYNSKTVTGYWTTGSTYPMTFSGTVKDADGAIAPYQTTVYAWCYDSVDGFLWNGEAYTNATGYYSISNVYAACADYGEGYHVAVLPWGTYFNVPGSLYGWPGHWNETIVVWAPQVVNFYVPLDQDASQPVAVAMEFTHTSHATVSYCHTSSSQVETESDYSVSGTLQGLSYSASSSIISLSSFGSQSCIDDQTTPGYEDWGYPYVSGDVMFNAIESRSISFPWTQYYGGLNDPTVGNATGAPVQDWLAEPTSSSQACMDTNGNVWFHLHIPAGSATQTFSVTDAGTVTSVASEEFGVSIPLELDGVSIGTFGGSWGYSFTTSETNAFAVSWTIPGPVSHDMYFTAVCSGTGSPQSGSGLVVHVWQDSGA